MRDLTTDAETKVGKIIEAMGHEDPRRRIQAIKAAATCRDLRLADAALQALEKEKIPQLRLGFVQLVGILGESRHGSVLAQYRSDPVDAVRYRCFEALVRIGDPSLFRSLVFGVSDEEKKIRTFCVAELLKLEGKAFPELLASMLAEGNEEERVKAVDCAGKFLSTDMVKLLVKVVGDSEQDEDLRKRARAGIETLAEKGSKRAKKWLKRQQAAAKRSSSPPEAKARSSRRKSHVDLEPVRLGPIRTDGRAGSVEESESASPAALTPSRARPSVPRRPSMGSKALRPRSMSSRSLIPMCPSGIRGVAHWDYFIGGMNLFIAAIAMISGHGIMMVASMLFGAIGAFHIWMGRALKEGRPWARTANIVFAILQLPSVPIGTLIGILILHTLYSDEGKSFFGK